MKLNLDLSGVSTMSSRVVLPTGNYPVEIVNAEAKETKSGGGMLVVGYKVLAGEYAGSVVSDNYNIINKSEDAQRIALSTIKTILTVGGHKNPNALGDTNELLGLKLTTYVEEEDHTFTSKSGDEVETTQNNFKGFFEFSEEAAAPAPKKEAKKEKAAKESASPFAQQTAKEEAPAPAAEEKVAEAAPTAFPWQQ